MQNEAIAKCARCNNVIIMCSTSGKVPAEAWNHFIKEFRTGEINKFLSLSIGMTDVNSTQRAEGVQIAKEKNCTVSVVTDERLMRGLVTAASWLGANVKAFAWDQLEDAVKHFGLSSALETRVLDTARALRRQCENELAKQDGKRAVKAFAR
jgi:hypothetical protein